MILNLTLIFHRVVLGSIERFMGILIEHFAGKFPLWLSTVQVKILPISDKFVDYVKVVEASLKAEGLHCEVDARPEKIGYKIRGARLERVPYMLIVGEKEAESNTYTPHIPPYKAPSPVPAQCRDVSCRYAATFQSLYTSKAP